MTRLTSLDAFRGFVMLMMASSGFAIARVWENSGEELVAKSGLGKVFWSNLAHQLSHAEWVGCSLWDLIQPAFMFMVGVSMPFSYLKRHRAGHSGFQRFMHALVRSFVLVFLGVMLSTVGDPMVDFTFVNVLTQIGLGYMVLYLLMLRGPVFNLVVIAAILGGYGYWFAQYEIPDQERQDLYAYLDEQGLDPKEEVDKFDNSYAAHWNKHTNAGAGVDRILLNLPPRPEEEFRGKRFWTNKGGYVTLNFVPSIATMLFGLIVGQTLIGPLTEQRKCRRLLAAGIVLLMAGMALDTYIWPIDTGEWGWTVCPTVKRIWTPTWAIFSTGWVLLMMGVFVLLFDVWNMKWLAFPFVVVGMNSITFYMMAQLIKGWLRRMLEAFLATTDACFGQFSTFDPQLVERFFGENNVYAPINLSLLVLGTMWLIALYLYKKKIFIRI
jgi:predicted acyltransferase